MEKVTPNWGGDAHTYLGTHSSGMYAFALLLEPRIMCFSDQTWRLNPLHTPSQTARWQGKPEHSISWLTVHESWGRGMTLANIRCQVDLALPECPCLRSTRVALRDINTAPGKARPGDHRSTLHGMEKQPSKKTQMQKQKRASKIRSSKTTYQCVNERGISAIYLITHKSTGRDCNNLGAKSFEGLVANGIWWFLFYKWCFSNKDRASNLRQVFTESMWVSSSCYSEFTITAWSSSTRNLRAGLGLTNSLLFVGLWF